MKALTSGFEESTVEVILPDDLAAVAGLTEPDVRAELAVMLYQGERLTLAQAACFAGMDRIAFYSLLAEHEVPLNYDFADFEQDLASLRSLGHL